MIKRRIRPSNLIIDLLVGISGMAISLIFMSIIFAYSDISNNINDDHSQSHLSPAMSGLILFLVCTYIASYGIGYGPVTWLVASEIFSDEIRGKCSLYDIKHDAEGRND